MGTPKKGNDRKRNRNMDVPFPGPKGPEMQALSLAFQGNSFQTNGQTRCFMYIDMEHHKLGPTILGGGGQSTPLASPSEQPWI